MIKQGRVIGSVLTTETTIGVTYPSPIETTYSTPVVIPLTEPVGPQVTYTLQASNLPTVAGTTVGNYTLATVMYASCYFSLASGTRTIYWNLKKNNVSVNTGFGVLTAGKYGTLTAPVFSGAVAGDTISLALWSDDSSCTLVWQGIATGVSNIKLGDTDKILYDVNITNVAQPAFVGGINPFKDGTAGVTLYNGSNTSVTTATSLSIPACRQDDTYKANRVQYGDIATTPVWVESSGGYTPFYKAYTTPSSIRYTGTILRI